MFDAAAPSLLNANLPAVDAGFTRRYGGSSAAPRESLNLGQHVGDAPGAVAENRARVAALVGKPIVYMNQVHGTAVTSLVTEADVAAASGGTGLTCDALVTNRRDIAVAVMVADCVPILLVEPQAGVIGAAHAGRQGMASGVAAATVRSMQALGADVAAIRVAMGPSVCARCYEVPESLAAEVEAVRPGVRSLTSWGTPSIDVAAGVALDLVGVGVPAAQIASPTVCTFESEDYFSYRRSMHTGRFAGLISLP